MNIQFNPAFAINQVKQAMHLYLTCSQNIDLNCGGICDLLVGLQALYSSPAPSTCRTGAVHCSQRSILLQGQ